jgi:hypothetical protein
LISLRIRRIVLSKEIVETREFAQYLVNKVHVVFVVSQKYPHKKRIDKASTASGIRSRSSIRLEDPLKVAQRPIALEILLTKICLS